jgi:LPXTG-site transpeptidase (sortase) family protein
VADFGGEDRGSSTVAASPPGSTPRPGPEPEAAEVTAVAPDPSPEPEPADQDRRATQSVQSRIERPATRSASLAEAQTDQVAPPVRVRVPAAGMDAPLDQVGVAPDGQMEIPDDAARGGWYKFGPAPGSEQGSAVLAGHVDDRFGRAGSFLLLTQAQEGDEVLIDHADGSRTTYRITTRQTVAKAELAVQDLFRRDGEPNLVLVTCTGDWSPQTGYLDNLVLTAVPTGG